MPSSLLFIEYYQCRSHKHPGQLPVQLHSLGDIQARGSHRICGRDSHSNGGKRRSPSGLTRRSVVGETWRSPFRCQSSRLVAEPVRPASACEKRVSGSWGSHDHKHPLWLPIALEPAPNLLVELECFLVRVKITKNIVGGNCGLATNCGRWTS